jgi:hypothetical protein
MKWFWGTVWTSLLGAISALLVVVFQDSVKDAFDGTNLTADVYSAPWQPLPNMGSEAVDEALEGTAIEAMGGSLVDPDNHPLVLIRLRNNGIQDVDGVRLQVDPDLRALAVIMRPIEPGSRRHTVESLPSLADAQIGEIPAGGSVHVYAWLPFTADITYSMSDLRVFTPDERFIVAFQQYENSDAEFYDEPVWYDWVDVGIPILLFALLVFLIGLLFFGMAMMSAYTTKMLKDADFYLKESVRYGDEKAKFKPDTSGLIS